MKLGHWIFVEIMCFRPLRRLTQHYYQRRSNDMVILSHLSHAAMITQQYEQFWYKPIPHDIKSSCSITGN